MNGFDRLKEQVKDQNDQGLIQTVNYLLSRKDMESKYLNKEKSLDQMCNFIRSRGNKHCHDGWTYIPDNIVHSWAIMYYSLPNKLLKITSTPTKKTEEKSKNNDNLEKKNNVISIEKAKKSIKQLSLFGGEPNE